MSRRADSQLVIRDIVRNDGTRTHDRMGANPDSPCHGHVRRDPGVISDFNGTSPLGTIGVDRVLVGVKDPAPRTYHGKGSNLDRFFRAQMAAIQEDPPAKVHPAPVKNREMDRLQFAS